MWCLWLGTSRTSWLKLGTARHAFCRLETGSQSGHWSSLEKNSSEDPVLNQLNGTGNIQHPVPSRTRSKSRKTCEKQNSSSRYASKKCMLSGFIIICIRCWITHNYQSAKFKVDEAWPPEKEGFCGAVSNPVDLWKSLLFNHLSFSHLKT